MLHDVKSSADIAYQQAPGELQWGEGACRHSIDATILLAYYVIFGLVTQSSFPRKGKIV